MLPLTLQARTTGTGPLIEVGGALDFETAQDFHDLLPTLALLPGQQLSLDLGAVEFFDSSGVRALLAARSRAIGEQADLALLAVPGHVARVLDALGLQGSFSTDRLPPPAG